MTFYPFVFSTNCQTSDWYNITKAAIEIIPMVSLCVNKAGIN